MIKTKLRMKSVNKLVLKINICARHSITLTFAQSVTGWCFTIGKKNNTRYPRYKYTNTR